VKSIPQEAQRFEVPHYFLDVTIRYIFQYVQGRPIKLIINLDEVSISEWEDFQNKERDRRRIGESVDDIL
jgi:hypothetical protein